MYQSENCALKGLVFICLKGQYLVFNKCSRRLTAKMRSLPFSPCFSPLALCFFPLLPFKRNVPSQVEAKEKLREGGISCHHRSKVWGVTHCRQPVGYAVGGASPEGLLEEVTGLVAILPSSDVEYFSG